MKTLGIVAHSAEGGALCFITACREGQRLLGAHMHPDIVVSAIPMAASMEAWEADDLETVGGHLRRGVEQVAAAGADFFILPDNTAHIALERVADTLPIPGLHIADVVCREIVASGWKRAALLGTKWTMNGPVYANALRRHGIERMLPERDDQVEINRAIFDELCLRVFPASTTARFVRIIDGLKGAGADCAILGCTEIPLIISEENSPLPVLDSTRLLARHGVRVALSDAPIPRGGGWIAPG